MQLIDLYIYLCIVKLPCKVFFMYINKLFLKNQCNTYYMCIFSRVLFKDNRIVKNHNLNKNNNNNKQYTFISWFLHFIDVSNEIRVS